jgi:hypothetical protein
LFCLSVFCFFFFIAHVHSIIDWPLGY